jgi:hypothetical protein
MAKSGSRSFRTRLSANECLEKLKDILVPSWVILGGGGSRISGIVRDNTVNLRIGSGSINPFQPTMNVIILEKRFGAEVAHNIKNRSASRVISDRVKDAISSTFETNLSLWLSKKENSAPILMLVASIVLLPWWAWRGLIQRKRLTRFLKTTLLAEESAQA